MNTTLESKAGKYVWHDQWVQIPAPTEKHEGRTHGIVAAKSGDIYIFHQASPAVIAYSPQGKLLKSWGDYPGAHGMTLVEENGGEYLWLVDQDKCSVEKLTIDGKLVQSIGKPPHPAYELGRYIPTWASVNPVNGDIWVADGYGSYLVHRYTAQGTYMQTIDGSEGTAGKFNCPHGILFDPRKSTPELYIADRGNHRVQVYSGEGKFFRSFGADYLTSPCGFAFSGDRVIVPELFGRIAILDAKDNLLDYVGENAAINTVKGWPNETPLEVGKFNSPHGACADAEGNIYVVEWRTGGRITKLEKLSINS